MTADLCINWETDRLKTLPIFRGVDPGKLKLLAFTGERRLYGSGEAVVRQGDVSDSVFVILDGEADAFLQLPSGERRHLGRMRAGEVIGELGVLNDAPRAADVIANSSLTLLQVRRDVFLDLLQDIPQFAMAVLRELAKRLGAMTRQLNAA